MMYNGLSVFYALSPLYAKTLLEGGCGRTHIYEKDFDNCFVYDCSIPVDCDVGMMKN